MLSLIALFAVFMVNGTPRRRTRRTPRRNARRRPQRRLRTALHGAEYRPNQDPPTIVQQPYNNLVVTSIIDIPAPTAPATKTVVNVTIKEIGDALWAQLGATQNPSLSFKILRAALWLTNGSYFGVTFLDLQRSIQNSQRECSLEDSAAKNHFARVGVRWSAADSSVPYATNGDTSAAKTVMSIQSPTAATVLLHVQTLWRGTLLSDPGVPAVLRPLNCFSYSLNQDPITSLCDLLRQNLLTGSSQHQSEAVSVSSTRRPPLDSLSSFEDVPSTD